jgi:hypothetical protein
MYIMSRLTNREISKFSMREKERGILPLDNFLCKLDIYEDDPVRCFREINLEYLRKKVNLRESVLSVWASGVSYSCK